MADYIPTGDSDFNTWQDELVTYATTPANKTRMQLSDSQLAPVTEQQAVWEAKYPAHITAQTAAEAAQTAKVDARTAYTTPLRILVGQLQTNPNVTDEDRRAMKITIKSDSRTPVGVPTTAPVAEIDLATRLVHTINFRDSATPSSKAKPEGVRGCQIWMKAGGEAPTSEKECQFLATDTKTPYVHHFELSEGGLMIYYLLRWENTRGETGPWSEVLSARVPS